MQRGDVVVRAMIVTLAVFLARRNLVVDAVKAHGHRDNHGRHGQCIEKCRQERRDERKHQRQHDFRAHAQQYLREYVQQHLTQEVDARNHEHQKHDDREIGLGLVEHHRGSRHTQENRLRRQQATGLQWITLERHGQRENELNHQRPPGEEWIDRHQDRVKDQEADNRQLVPDRRIAEEIIPRGSCHRVRHSLFLIRGDRTILADCSGDFLQTLCRLFGAIPDAGACFTEFLEHGLVGRGLLVTGFDDDEIELAGLANVGRALPESNCSFDLGIKRQRCLAARHRQVHECEQLSVYECTMHIALRGIDVVALAQCIEAVALSRMDFARQCQRIKHTRVLGDLRLRVLHELELILDKANIEISIVNDEFGVFDECEELVSDVGKSWCRLQVFVADAVDALGALFDVAIRVEEAVKLAARQTTIDEFNAADFDDAVALADGEARGFGVEYDLTHCVFEHRW